MNKKQKTIIGIIVFIALAFLILNQYSELSLVSISTTTFEENGKIFWVISSVGDSIDEGFHFKYKVGQNIDDEENSRGEIIQPQKDMSVYFSKEESKCNYVLREESKTVLIWWDIDYHILSNPSREALIKIRDSNGKVNYIDGAVNGDTAFLEDEDGEGELKVKALGLISGSSDCPNYENIAIVKDGDDNYKIVNRNDYEYAINKIGWGIFTNPFQVLEFLFGEIRENTQFTSAFNSYPQININAMTLIGDIDIGSGFFTVTADQDYFDSVTYSPPTESDPQIDSINMEDKIEKASTQRISVDLKNRNNIKAQVLVKATSENSGVSPSSKQLTLDNRATVEFELTATDSLGNGKVCFEACSVGQFEASNCDYECKTFEIVGDVPNPDKCDTCWAWLKDKLGMEQSCETGFFRGLWNNLNCPFYFLKLAIVLMASIFGYFLGRQFSERQFKKQTKVVYIILGLITSGIVGFIGYTFLEWYFIIPLAIIMFFASTILNAIPKPIRRYIPIKGGAK